MGEAAEVVTHEFGRLMVERVVRVGLNEQEHESENDGIDTEHGSPVVFQDIEADISLQVNVRVVDLGLTLAFGRIIRVVGADLESKDVFSAAPDGLFLGEVDDDLELGDVAVVSPEDFDV